MKIESSNQTVLYSIEKAIKSYRKFASRNIKIVDDSLTVDQAFLLLIIYKNPEYTQVEIAEVLFKDYASITRMIESMNKKQLILRSPNTKDRRTHSIRLTKRGISLLERLEPIIQTNREQAMNGFLENEIEQLNTMLQKIISNCNVSKN